MMTPEIKVLVNDRRIWNPMATAAKICQALNQHPQVNLCFNSEAPDMVSTELPEFFEVLKNTGVDLSRITVRTGNLMESYNGVNIDIFTGAMYELSLFQKICKSLPKEKNIKYHFGILVGRCTFPRLVLSSFLFDNFRDKTFQTFHWQANNAYHRTHLELEQVIHEYGINSVEFDQAIKLLKHAPLLKEQISSYPILHPQNLAGACAWYTDFFVDIVCETWYNGDTFFLTEKFWRAVATRTPFILHGPQWILQRLKKLGFKTFDSWWDEGYSEDPCHHNMLEIKKVLNFLSNKSLAELNHIYSEMGPTLDHNLQVMQNLKYEDFDILNGTQNAQG